MIKKPGSEESVLRDGDSGPSEWGASPTMARSSTDAHVLGDEGESPASVTVRPQRDSQPSGKRRCPALCVSVGNGGEAKHGF